MVIKSFAPAIVWLILSTILLLMPGSDIPDVGFFNLPYFDKFVHVAMFLFLTGLFCYPLAFTSGVSVVKSWFTKVALYCLIYGIAMEFVQKHFVSGRSFDVVDIVCDGIGCLVGAVLAFMIYRKKIGPDGNQGRNQN